MAVFTAANANVAVNMFDLFAFETTFGTNTIDDIQVAPGIALVSDFPPSTAVPVALVYSNNNDTEVFGKSGLTPVSGSFDKIEILIDGELRGTLSDITPGLGNFGEIELVQAYNVLLGDDSITGSDQSDVLYMGPGGTDTVDAKGGGDFIEMVATAFAPFHSIDGGAGIDWIDAGPNILTGDTVLDLRNATLQSIEGFGIYDGATVRLLGSQIGAGVSSSAHVSDLGSGNGSLEVVLNAAGAANLSGLDVEANLSVRIFGSTGADTITGSIVADAIRGEGGKDVLAGGAGGDTFEYLAVADSTKKKALRDTITDFTKGDRIDLSGIDAVTKKKPGDQAFKFKKKEGAALKKAGDLVYDQIDKKGTAQDKTVIYADVDGDHKADMAIELKGIVDLGKSDFIL